LWSKVTSFWNIDRTVKSTREQDNVKKIVNYHIQHWHQNDCKQFYLIDLVIYLRKELSLCHKLWFLITYIFGTKCRKPLIFQTYIISSNRSHSLKCNRSTTLESRDLGIRKSELVAKTQFLYKTFILLSNFSKIQFETFKIATLHGIHFILT